MTSATVLSVSHQVALTAYPNGKALQAVFMQVVSESKEVTLPSGVKYKDLKIGGGSNTQKGYLMVVDYK